MKRVSRLAADLKADPSAVFALITGMDASWRSDLKEIEQTSDGFIEYPQKGSPTEFVITCKQPGFYSFTMRNSHLQGEWTGELTPAREGGTHLVFTETVEIRSPVIWLFAKRYLAGMQRRYLADLKRKLEES